MKTIKRLNTYAIRTSIVYVPSIGGTCHIVKEMAKRSMGLIAVLIIFGLIYSNLNVLGNKISAVASESIAGFDENIEESEANIIKTDVITTTSQIDEPLLIEPVQVQPSTRYLLSDDEYLAFAQIVEAEVTGDFINNPYVSYEDGLLSKVRVAQVILNRIESPDFPNNILDVIYQKEAFSPVADGRMWSVTVTDTTREAINIALSPDTEDYTYGALYFRSDSTSCDYGYWLMTDPVGHSFFHSY